MLLPGETQRIRRGATEVALLAGEEDRSEPLSPLLDRLIRQLPVEGGEDALRSVDTIDTPLGRRATQGRPSYIAKEPRPTKSTSSGWALANS